MKRNFADRIKESYPDGGYTVKKFVAFKRPAIIVCPDHGEFTTDPDNLLYNRGCLACRGRNDRYLPLKKRKVPEVLRKRQATFYVLSSSGAFFKIGVTIGEPFERLKQIQAKSSYRFELVYSLSFRSRMACNRLESFFKYLLPKYKIVAPEYMHEGVSEIFDKKYLPYVLEVLQITVQKT